LSPAFCVGLLLYGRHLVALRQMLLSYLAHSTALPEIERVKNYRAILAIGLSFALAFSGFARAETTWQTDYKKAQQEAKASNKPLLINFTGSDWCPPCKLLEKEIFSTREFQDYASKNFVLLEIDFPRRKEQSRELARQNQELGMQYGIEFFPSIIVLSNEGKKIGELLGYDPGTTVDAYIAELEKFRKS
jgi:thioredoxin-related protein